MKKFLLTLVLVTSFISTYGQSKRQKEQSQVFTDAAAKEYDLDDAQKEKIYDLSIEMRKIYSDNNKAEKSGEITLEEKKAKNREASKTFQTELSKITGKSYKEMKPWLDEMREKMKKK